MATTTPNFGWSVPTSSDLVKNGATAIETLGDSIDASLVDLKGGTTGQVLAKATGTDMDFTWTTPSGGSNAFYAGKNKIINGDFRVNQRSFTSNTTSGTFNFDRWQQANSGGTFTLTPQTFTPGAAPVAGYEGSTYLRGITATQSAAGDFALFEEKIEDVRTLAGSTATVSFWAKANSGTPKIGVELSQNFGSGGSPSATVNTALGAVTLSTSWARYSVSVAVPSLSGKTIGTTANTSFVEANFWVSAGSTLATRASSIGIQNNTFDIWGVQVEAGSTASDFQTATGTIQGELAACQRYYWRQTGTAAGGAFGFGFFGSTTRARVLINLPMSMRVAPTAIEYSTVGLNDNATQFTVTAIQLYENNKDNAVLVLADVASGATQYRPTYLNYTSPGGYFGLTAEL